MKKKFVVLITIFLILISGGIGLATFFISSANEHAVTFDDDTEALYHTTLLETPKDGTNPNNYDAKTNVYYALYNLEHKEAFSCTTTGTAKASVATQIISNSRVVIGDKALVSTISDGIIKVGTQKYFVNGGKKVLLRSSESISDAKATWKKDVPECITDKAYIQRYGWLPFKSIGYIICDDTILETSEMTYENGIYEVSLTLDPAPDKAPYWYKREVATNGSSTMVPEFSYINLTYKFDNNWNVLEVHAEEKYLVKSMGIKTTCETNCYDKYSYDNVEFDKDSYEFFKQYEALEAASEENENNESSKIDALTMLTSSLTNKDSFESLNIDIKFNNKEVNGLAALDINDLNNIKVKALVGDLYLEYSDLLYISLGELKLKSDTNTLKDLLNEFNGTIPNVEAIDTASILAAFDNANIKEIENESVVNVTFNLFGYDINLEYSIYKDNDNYILNYARINAEVEGNIVQIDATPSEKTFPTYDKEAFSDLSNLDYLFKFLSKLVLYNNVEADFDISYKGLNANLNLKATFKDSIALKALVNVNYKDNNYNLVLTCLNDFIYVSYDDVNLMISKDDLINIINKYTNKLNDMKSIDVKKIIDTIIDLNYYNLFKEVSISSEELVLTSNLKDLIGLLDDIKLTISSGDDFNIGTSYKDLNLEGSIKAIEELEINLDDKEYNNIYYVDDFLDKILTIINSKKLESIISLNYKDYNILGNVKLDFNDLNNLKAEAKLTISKDNNFKELNVIFINNTIYLEIANQKLSLTIDSLKEILSKFDINLDLENEIKSNNILDIILSIDFEKLIKELKIEKNQILLNLDISDYINSIDNLEIKLINNLDSIDLSLNIFDVKANVKSSDFEIAEPTGYQSLDSLIGLVDNIKSIIETKKVEANVSLNVKGLDITGKAHVDFTDLNDLKVEAALTVSKDNKSQNLNVIFYNNVIYVEVAGQKLSLTLDGLKSILSKFDIDLNLNTNLDVDSIIDKVISLDFAKLIQSLTISENKLSLGLDLSDLIKSLNELNIELINNKNSIDLTLNKFDVKANVKASDFEIVEPEDYQSLDNVIGLVDNIKSIIETKKIEANVSLNVKGLDITGTTHVDFTDLNNFKAEATLTVSKNGNSQELNVTFYNNVIYVQVAGQKLSLTLDGLKEILSKFDIDLNVNTNLDVNSIIDKVLSLDFAKVIQKLAISENKLSLGLDLSDLIKSLDELSIEVVNKSDSIDLAVNKFDIKANVKSSNFEIAEPRDYQSLDNLIGLVDNIKSIIDTKKIEATISLEYKGIEISGLAHIDFNDLENLKVEATLTVSKGDNSQEVNVVFYNNVIYVQVAGQKLSLTLDGLKEVLAKFDINLDLNTNLDVNAIIDKVLSLDFNKLIQKLAISENKLSLGLDLSDLIKSLDELSIEVVNKSDSIDLAVNKFDIKANVKSSNFEITEPTDYQSLDNLVGLVDNIKSIIDAKKIEANVSLSYKEISIAGTAHVDFTDLNNLKAEATLTVSKNGNSQELNVTFYNNVIYVEVAGQKLSLTLDGLKEILAKFDINFDLNTDIDVNNIIDKVLSLDFNKLIQTLSITENKLSLGLDLSDFISSLNDLNIELINNTDSIDLELNKFDVNANVKASDFEITEPTDYQSLDNLIGLVDNVKAIIESKKVETNVSLSYEGLNITGLVYIDFNDLNDLKAEAELTVSKNDNSQELNITFYNNVIYVEVAGQKLSLTLDGLKEILAKFDIDLNLDTEFDVNSIIDKVLSLDFTKLIQKLTINENKLETTLNLSDFIKTIDELSIVLVNNTDSIDLTADKFDVKANVKSSDFEIVEPRDYQSLDNIIGLVDNIKSIIDTKKIEANISLNYEGFIISGIINVDFNDLDNLMATGLINLRKDNFEIDVKVSFVNNIIYLDVAGQKLSLTLDGLKSILAKFDINLDSNFDLDNFIDKVLSIDLEKLIQKIEVEDNLISLGLDLSDLTSLISNINLSINNYDDYIGLKSDKYDLFVSVMPKSFDLNVLGDYEQIDNIIEFVDIVKKVIDNKKFKANLSGNYKDILFDGYALIDFNEDIKVKAIIDLSYKNINVPLELYYFDKFNDLSNVIYLNVNNIHGFIKLEDILSILNVDTNDSIVDKLSLINFEKLIENINIESNEINLNINLGYLLNDIFNIDLDLNELNLKVSKDNDHLNISSDIIDDLNISLFDNYNEEIKLPNYNYIDLSNILNNVSDILDIYNKKSFSINLDGNINLNKIIDLDLNLDIEFKAIAKFILNNDKYDIEVSIDIDNEKFEGNISLIIINKILYLKLSDIYIELDLNNINEFIKDIKEIFELDGDDLDLENVINSLISNIEFNDVNNILVDLNEVVSKLSILSIELNDLFNENSYIYLKNNNLEDLLNASIKLNVDESLSLSSLNNKYLNSNDVLNICKNIKSLIDLIKKKEFKINLGSEGNGIEYFEDGKLKFNVILDLDLSFVSNIKLNLNLRIDEYADGQYACTHKLNIIYVDGMMYATYGNSPSEREVIKAYSNKENILGLISSIEKVTGFNLEFINKYINYKEYENESLDHININNFKKLISKLITNSGFELGKININDVLRSLDVTSNVSTFGVDLSSVLNINNPYITLIDLIKTNNYPSLELDKLYLSYESNDKYKLIENVNVSFNDFEEVVVPTIDNSYYNLNDLSKLIDGLIIAASFNSYSIKGTVTLTANIVIKINVDIPIEAYVYVDDEGKPIVYGHIDMNDIPGIASIAGISKKDIYFVYENEYIYIYRKDSGGTTQKIKVSIETFMDDIVYYLLDFSMGLPDSILSLIGQNQKEGYQYINAYNAVNNYKSTISSNLQSFFFNLNMGELTNNSDLGDMSFNINLKPLRLEDDYKGFSAYSISNFNFDMVNILTLHSDELYLSNLKNENGVYVYNDAVIDGKNVLDYVDSYIKNIFYINSEEIEADIIYKNNIKDETKPHNAYFHYGNAVDLNGNSLETISIKTTAGESYGIPNGVEYAKINGKTYYFDGWYDNKNYEGEAFNYGDEAIMINKNVHYYAKWVLMYDYIVIDSLGNGLNKAYKYGELTDDYTIDNPTADFKGFFNSDTNELITTDSTLNGVIIENDITIYAKYSNMYYIVLDDEKNIALGKADSTLTISALTSNHYSIYDGVNYYVYNNTDITAKLLFDEYYSLFEIENIDNIQIGYIHLYTYKQAIDGYNNYKFNYNSNFKNELGNGLYTNVLIPNGTSFDSSYFQKGYFGNYEINAWVSNSGKYYNKFIEVEDGIYNFKAYVSTKLKVLNISSTTINGYKTNNNNTVLITPIYNEDGSVITKINSKAFESNVYLETVVISEGITNIGSDAFKNNTSLKKVYFADSVKNISSDSFYYTDGSNYKNITFYFTENSTCSKSNWKAYKSGLSYRYYGDKSDGFIGIGAYDLSNAFKTYSVKLYELNATLL